MTLKKASRLHCPGRGQSSKKNEGYFARLQFLYMSKQGWCWGKSSVTPSKFITCPVCGTQGWWLDLKPMEVHWGTSVYVISFSHKKEWNICSNMGGPRDYHIKWTKPDRERQISYGIIHMWNLLKKKYKMNLFARQK